MHIVYVSDGKAGHRSQALGLFQAMQRQQANATFEEVSINDLPVMSLIKALFLQKNLYFNRHPILYLVLEVIRIFVSGCSVKFSKRLRPLF